jgi:hypothetical protein
MYNNAEEYCLKVGQNPGIEMFISPRLLRKPHISNFTKNEKRKEKHIRSASNIISIRFNNF